MFNTKGLLRMDVNSGKRCLEHTSWDISLNSTTSNGEREGERERGRGVIT